MRAHVEKVTVSCWNKSEEVYVYYSTTHVKESFPEISKASAKLSTKYMPQNRTDIMLASSKNQNYRIGEIIYNIYEDNIFQNKNEIYFVSITPLSFIKYTANVGHWMELTNTSVKPYDIVTLKKQLYKVELKPFCRYIYE